MKGLLLSGLVLFIISATQAGTVLTKVKSPSLSRSDIVNEQLPISGVPTKGSVYKCKWTARNAEFSLGNQLTTANFVGTSEVRIMRVEPNLIAYKFTSFTGTEEAAPSAFSRSANITATNLMQINLARPMDTPESVVVLNAGPGRQPGNYGFYFSVSGLMDPKKIGKSLESEVPGKWVYDRWKKVWDVNAPVLLQYPTSGEIPSEPEAATAKKRNSRNSGSLLSFQIVTSTCQFKR